MTTPSSSPGFIGRLFAPPARQVALLSDGRFFARAVPLAPETTAATVTEQIELALETLSPFPLAQLYYGHHWVPGASHALVFAAYRKRFPADETESWHVAELVAPAFALLLTVPAATGTVRLLVSPDAVTLVQWGNGAEVASQVTVLPVPPDATEAERTAVRDQALRSLGSNVTAEEWTMPELAGMTDGGEFTFISAEQEIKLSREDAVALDVRDKLEHLQRQKEKKRDILLWRTFLGLAALIALCVLGQGAILVGKSRLQAHQKVLADHLPEVKKLTETEQLADQIEQVVARRLLPLEMLSLVSSNRPVNTVLLSSAMDSLYNFTAQARTNTPTEIDEFKTALLKLPQCEKVDVTDSPINNGIATFKIVVRFKPGVLEPEPADAATAVETPAPAAPKTSS